MDLRFTADQERFRAEARAWLTDRLDGRFAVVRGRGGPGDEHELFDERLEWEQELGRDGWIGLGLARRVRRPRRDAASSR